MGSRPRPERVDRLYLVGFMGCGKSRVGRLLADASGRRFVDLDHEIESAAEMSIRDIFARRGEDGFRDLEHEVLQDTKKWHNVVVATGGGVMAFARNRQVLADLGTTVWIDVPFDVIVDRMSPAGRSRRPLFDDLEVARALYDHRRMAYRRADFGIQVAAADEATDVTARILHHLRAQKCVI